MSPIYKIEASPLLNPSFQHKKKTLYWKGEKKHVAQSRYNSYRSTNT
jgi:hypothetical protein